MPYCTSCGYKLPPSGQYCPSCGANFRSENLQSLQHTSPIQSQPRHSQYNNNPVDKIPNHFVKAIISAVLCQLLGIVAIIFASQVDSKYKAGDLSGALKASKNASLFGNLGLVFGIIINIFVFIATILEEAL